MKPVRRTVPDAATVRIERIGAEGDGVVRLPDGAFVYVPLTLPGETVRVRPIRPLGSGWLAEAEAIEAAGPERAAAPCGHFGRCGGCVLQHWSDKGYRLWKAGLVAAALRQAGFAPPDPLPFRHGLPGERRRMDFAARRIGAKLVLGLHAVRSDTVEDLSGCLVLHPVLHGLLAPLRTLLSGLSGLRREGSVIINLLDSGPDLMLRTDAPLSLADRTALAAFATSHGLPRIAWVQGSAQGSVQGNGAPETVAQPRPSATALSGVTVRPPPGAFLQATEAGEQAIVEAVLAGLPRKLTARSRIAELYAGCGTISFALARVARVTAFEGDAAALAALRQGVNQGGLAGRVEPMLRDLVRQPVSARELGPFAAVVLDPPFAGAAGQVGQIAASGIGTVIYVSCNPMALARDAKALGAAGYRLEAVTAIDQFLWSARVESVVVFRR